MATPTATTADARRSVPAPRPHGAGRRFFSVYGGYVLGFVSLFVLWQLASRYLVSSVLFPPPTVVFSKALTLLRNGVLVENLSASMQRILVGFANHPNVSAYVLVGLGCEVSFAQHIVETNDLVVLGGVKVKRNGAHPGEKPDPDPVRPRTLSGTGHVPPVLRA